jgi:hypothetical protein
MLRRSQSEVNARADVGNVVLKELTVRRRPLVHLEHQQNESPRVPFGTRPSQLQPDSRAHRRRPVVKLRGFHIDASQHLRFARATAAQLGAHVEQRIRQGVRLPPEDAFGTRIDAKHAEFLRYEELQRFEREVFADDLLAAQEVLVSQVGALVIQLGAYAEAAPPERQRYSENVVGVDQIVGRRTKVELGEDAPDDIELQAFARARAPEAHQAEAVADADRRD